MAGKPSGSLKRASPSSEYFRSKGDGLSDRTVIEVPSRTYRTMARRIAECISPYAGMQARDHPVLVTVPETYYLKCLILRKA